MLCLNACTTVKRLKLLITLKELVFSRYFICGILAIVFSDVNRIIMMDEAKEEKYDFPFYVIGFAV